MPSFHVQFIACNVLQFFCRLSNGMENIHAATFSLQKYFPSRWKACNYRTKNCSALHAKIAHETTASV